jgi:hypothetical protein
LVWLLCDSWHNAANKRGCIAWSSISCWLLLLLLAAGVARSIESGVDKLMRLNSIALLINC